jgi:fructose-1,6-bisphosphatase/inositol monophosphatase family enzyme
MSTKKRHDIGLDQLNAIADIAMAKMRAIIEGRHDGDEVVRDGVAFGDGDEDVEIAADRMLGNVLRKNIARANAPISRISVEGFEDMCDDTSGQWVCVDPLDGSLNFQTRSGTIGLPHSLVVTILGVDENACFSDITAGLIMDYRTGQRWIALPGPGEGPSYITVTRSGDDGAVEERVWTASPDTFDLGRQIVFGEMYYPENRERLCKAFAGERGWLRNPGSAGYEMAMVANGMAVGYACNTQKQHELGAAYAIVRGAGGVVTDLCGESLDHRPFTFHKKTPVILAANETVHSSLVCRLSQ